MGVYKVQNYKGFRSSFHCRFLKVKLRGTVTAVSIQVMMIFWNFSTDSVCTVGKS